MQVIKQKNAMLAHIFRKENARGEYIGRAGGSDMHKTYASKREY